MEHKRYTVISRLTPRGPEYRIYDSLMGASLEGGFDTQKWAEAMAEMMEEKWRNERKASSRMDVTAGNHGRHTRPHDKRSGKDTD